MKIKPSELKPSKIRRQCFYSSVKNAASQNFYSMGMAAGPVSRFAYAHAYLHTHTLIFICSDFYLFLQNVNLLYSEYLISSQVLIRNGESLVIG